MEMVRESLRGVPAQRWRGTDAAQRCLKKDNAARERLREIVFVRVCVCGTTCKKCPQLNSRLAFPRFGNLPETMISLWSAVSGGNDWMNYGDYLRQSLPLCVCVRVPHAGSLHVCNFTFSQQILRNYAKTWICFGGLGTEAPA